MAVLTAGALVLYRDLSSELGAAITNVLRIRITDLATDYEDGEVTTSAGLVATQVVSANGNVISPLGAPSILSGEERARAAQGPIIIDRAVTGVGGRARLLARPIQGRGATAVIGLAAASTQPLAEARDRLALVLAVAGPALAAAIGATAWILTGLALRPVRRMSNEAALISTTRAGHRLAEPPGDDEIAQLGRTLNAMLTRIESSVARERSFIDDAAHELRTPIAVLRGELELARLDLDDRAAVAEGLTSALEEADRLARLAQDLLTLARADAGQLVPSEATTELLDETRAALRRLPHRAELTIEVRGEPTEVRGDPEWIHQIVTNLVTNADRYAKTAIVVTAESVGDNGKLVVADDGPGFPEHLLPNAFDRFARGDGARGRSEGGTGLGLAITASFVRALGGTVSACNGAPLAGGCVEVELPLAAS
jgi:signal transduction histidine kinase